MYLNRWLAFRLSIVGLAVLQGAFLGDQTEAERNVEWLRCLLLIAVAPVMVLFVVGIQSKNPLSAEVWRYPAWSINPFLFAEPLQGFHLIGVSFIGFGSAAIISQILQSNPKLTLMTDVLAVGVGILIGVYLATLVYRRKMTGRG